MKNRPHTIQRLKQNPQGKLISWYRTNPTHSNQLCPYCGRGVGQNSPILSNREHLFARNFPPAEAWTAGSFNFLFRACMDCNSEKAVFERQVATSTLLMSPALQTDERALSDAHRKGSNDYHSVQREPATGKKVLMRDALEKCEISFGPSAGVSCRIGFVAPATAPDRAIRGLAIRHVQGLFTLVTTPPDAYAEAGQQRFLPAAFVHVWSWYGPNNWGSAQLQAWTAKTRGWPLHANINTADGYVRAEMRRCASMQWFWFLEWNKALRVAGIIAPFGPIAIKEMRFLGDFDPTARLCITEEIPLAPEADVLFTDRIPDSFI